MGWFKSWKMSSAKVHDHKCAIRFQIGQIDNHRFSKRSELGAKLTLTINRQGLNWPFSGFQFQSKSFFPKREFTDWDGMKLEDELC